eukprot:scaffold18319_cov16-Tisochrysis_lutea.AAC.1
MEHPGKHPVRDASISCQGPSLAVPHAMDCSMWPLTIRACTEETKIKTSVGAFRVQPKARGGFGTPQWTDSHGGGYGTHSFRWGHRAGWKKGR